MVVLRWTKSVLIHWCTLSYFGQSRLCSLFLSLDSHSPPPQPPFLASSRTTPRRPLQPQWFWSTQPPWNPSLNDDYPAELTSKTIDSTSVSTIVISTCLQPPISPAQEAPTPKLLSFANEDENEETSHLRSTMGKPSLTTENPTLDVARTLSDWIKKWGVRWCWWVCVWV